MKGGSPEGWGRDRGKREDGRGPGVVDRESRVYGEGRDGGRERRKAGRKGGQIAQQRMREEWGRGLSELATREGGVRGGGRSHREVGLQWKNGDGGKVRDSLGEGQ